jgi:hypothetical protein
MLRHDDAAARTAQCLVRGRRDDMRVWQRTRVNARGDQAGDVRHVDEQVGADLVGDGAHARPVDDLRIRRKTGDDHLRLVFERELLHVVVVDEAVGVHAVLHRIEDLAGKIDLRAVGQMPAVGKRHAEDRVAGIEQRKVDGLIRLRAGVRLHVRVVRLEQLLDAFDRQLFGYIHKFATAVVTLAGIAFGVLVRQHRALGLEHARTGVVFRSDQLDVIFLALALGRNGVRQFGIVAVDLHFAWEHFAAIFA